MTDWNPGDPLYDGDTCFIRPMFELIEDEEHPSARWSPDEEWRYDD